ncbi:hypothetical protein HY486_03775 [Candidatus Woesearchaeota archaeon]|nr:hypothetical protein [Candidatus Woesearchaeota archaeon]
MTFTLEKLMKRVKSELSKPNLPDWDVIFANMRISGLLYQNIRWHQLKGIAGEAYMIQWLEGFSWNHLRVTLFPEPASIPENYYIIKKGWRTIINYPHQKQVELDGIVEVDSYRIFCEIKTGECRDYPDLLRKIAEKERVGKQVFCAPTKNVPWVLLLNKDEYSQRNGALEEWENAVRIVVPMYAGRSQFDSDLRNECKKRNVTFLM